jgi:hypothetical protein
MTANPTYVQTGKTAALTATYVLPPGVTGTPTYTWYPAATGATITNPSVNTGTQKITSTWNAPLPPLYQQSIAYPSIQVCNPSGGLCGNCGMPVATPPACTLNATCPITIVPHFTASGEVFIDNDKSGKVSAGDVGYPNDSIFICQYQNGICNAYETVTTDGSGNFTTTTGLTPGQYKATSTIVPPYKATTATSIIFTVGNASTGTPCQTPIGSCDANGSVTGLNFGMSDAFPWMQAVGGDITGNYISDPTKGGFTDLVPTAASVAAGVCSANGAYAMTNGAGGTHGLINTGSNDATFGNGQEAAAQNWVVGGLGAGSYQYVYNMPLSKTAKTSYANLSYLVRQSNLPTTNLNTIANCGVPSTDCKLPTDPLLFPAYLYTVDGDLNLHGTGLPESYTFPDGKYVILVKGDLNIDTNIIVPNGSFVLFSVSGNINVANTVGAQPGTTCLPAISNLAPNNVSTGCDLEGYYSTDKSFNVLGNDTVGQAANCAATPAPNPDLRLNVAGAIVVNAVTTNGGSFNYATRDMCGFDKQCPVFTITERADLLLNAPSYLMFPRRVWQEVAP